jgi:hypothetical protein
VGGWWWWWWIGRSKQRQGGPLPAQVGLAGWLAGTGSTARDVATRRKWAALWPRAPWVSLIVSTKGSNSIVVLRLPHSYGYHE